MTTTPTKLGPGTLTIGDEAAALDVSCALSAAGIAIDKSQDDPVPVLCGDYVASTADYTASLTGTMLLDLADPDSIYYYASAHRGEQVPVTFTPNTAAGAVITGVVTIDPLGIEGDVRANMTADFEWAFVEYPTITPPAAPPLGDDVEAFSTRKRVPVGV
jgi:hypothetical protein